MHWVLEQCSDFLQDCPALYHGVEGMLDRPALTMEGICIPTLSLSHISHGNKSQILVDYILQVSPQNVCSVWNHGKTHNFVFWLCKNIQNQNEVTSHLILNLDRVQGSSLLIYPLSILSYLQFTTNIILVVMSSQYFQYRIIGKVTC